MEPIIVGHSGFTVLGLRYQGKNEQNEIPALWAALWPRLGEIQGIRGQEIAYGVCDSYNPSTGELGYLAGVEVMGDYSYPEGMTSLDVPAGTYAVFKCTLPTLGETYDQLQAWLGGSAYERADGPEFELYDEKFDPQEPGSQLEVYIPVRKSA